MRSSGSASARRGIDIHIVNITQQFLAAGTVVLLTETRPCWLEYCEMTTDNNGGGVDVALYDATGALYHLETASSGSAPGNLMDFAHVQQLPQELFVVTENNTGSNIYRYGLTRRVYCPKGVQISAICSVNATVNVALNLHMSVEEGS